MDTEENHMTYLKTYNYAYSLLTQMRLVHGKTVLKLS